MRTFDEVFGWVGAALLLIGYMLVSFSVIPGNGILYQLINLVGSLGILAIALYKRDWQPGILNLVWAAIAFVAVVRILA